MDHTPGFRPVAWQTLISMGIIACFVPHLLTFVTVLRVQRPPVRLIVGAQENFIVPSSMRPNLSVAMSSR